MKQVAVTGATGFIGQHLCAALLHEGVALRVLGRRHANIEAAFYHWDMPDVLDSSALAGVDTIFHLAGKAHALSGGRQDEDLYFPINTEATRRLLEAAKDAAVRRFVYFSSVKATAEPGEDVVDEDDQSTPETMYGRSKRMAEDLVLQGGYVQEPVVLRPTMVYGASEKGNLPRMIKAISGGYFPLLPDTGHRRSMIHVDDVVQAAVLASCKPEAIGQIYILADGGRYATQHIHLWICDALSKSKPVHAWPLWLLRLLAYMGDGIGWMQRRRFAFDSDALDKLIGSSCYSSGKIEQELGFSARRDLRESVFEMVTFLREHK